MMTVTRTPIVANDVSAENVTVPATSKAEEAMSMAAGTMSIGTIATGAVTSMAVDFTVTTVTHATRRSTSTEWSAVWSGNSIAISTIRRSLAVSVVTFATRTSKAGGTI